MCPPSLRAQVRVLMGLLLDRHMLQTWRQNTSPDLSFEGGIVFCCLAVFSCSPLVMAAPWLSCANRAECWAAVSSGLGLSSMNIGGGPGGGGGGGGGQGPSEGALNSEGVATGPC